MTTLAVVMRNTGMNGPRIVKSPTRAVKEVSDLTAGHDISVQASGATVRSFGPWCSYSRLLSRQPLPGGGTRRVDMREG